VEFTTASTRGFFNLTTGNGLRPIIDLPNISEILDLDNGAFTSAITNDGAIDRVATDWKVQQWEFIVIL